MSWWNLWRTPEVPSVTHKLLEQNQALLERLMADSDAKTRLLDRIVTARYDPPASVGAEQQSSPLSAFGSQFGESFSAENDTDFLEGVSKIV